MKRSFRFARLPVLAVVPFVCLATTAKAALFEGSASAVFGTPTFSSVGAVFTGIGTNTFKSGHPVAGFSASTYQVDGLGFSTTGHNPFVIADLTYTNGPTYAITNVDAVPLDITLAFTSPGGISKTFAVGFEFEFTLNNTGHPVHDADVLRILAGTSSTSFSAFGSSWTFELLGFSNDMGSTIDDTFVLAEGDVTRSQLVANITRVSVSEPASLALIGLGLAAIGFSSRRKLLRID